jgi:homoserine kinase
MTRFVVRAPASTANLGPGFDCAAAALALWNELHVEERLNGGAWVEIEGEGADELPRDADHLALRAFALFAPPDRYSFRFVNRIPLERGLGSSAAAVAAGLVAGAATAGRSPAADDALVLGAELEGHADNLAAALRGGVCLAWLRGERPSAARIAADLPLAPVVVVPAERTKTSESREALPPTVRHAEAATAAGRAALLGAAIAAGNEALFRDAVEDDRLHEPYRASAAPLLGELRHALPDGAAGVTLSGSGPSVVVWVEKASVASVVDKLRRRVPLETRVLPLQIAARGAAA